MAYRVELAKTGRASCNGTGCKKEKTLIAKGELRQGTSVTIDGHTSMKWRHWGCVTPTVLHNWYESSGKDMDLIDGYDDLPPDVQAKVKRALEQEHVDDEDWNGDAEMNRYNPSKPMQGMFVKASAKKTKKKADDDDEVEKEATPTKKAPTKKRSRAKVDDEDAKDGSPEPAPKKSKRTKAVKAEDEAQGEPAASSKPNKKGKKANKAQTEDVPSDEAAAPPAKKGRRKKLQATEELDSDVVDAPAAEVAPPVKKGRARKKATEAIPSDEHAEGTEAPPKPARRQRRGKQAAGRGDEEARRQPITLDKSQNEPTLAQ